MEGTFVSTGVILLGKTSKISRSEIARFITHLFAAMVKWVTSLDMGASLSKL